MPDPEHSTTPIPSGLPDEGKQLGLLLDSARSMSDEELRRTERLEGKARAQFTLVGGLFAVVMATTAGVLNALLDVDSVAGWVYPVLGACALVSIVALIVAVAWTFEAGRLYKTDALDPKTLTQYIPYAERGNVGVAKNLITTYAQLLEDRRKHNGERAKTLKYASIACGAASVASLAQLAAVFIALISR